MGVLRIITSAAVGIPLTLSAILFVTAAVVAAELPVNRQLARWTSATSLLLSGIAMIAMITRFVVVAHSH